MKKPTKDSHGHSEGGKFAKNPVPAVLEKQPKATGSPPPEQSLVDEATKLLEVGAKIAERLNMLQLAEQVANNKSMQFHSSLRQRAAKLRGRMMKFSSIYNAAWMVRHYQRTESAAMEKAINDFCAVLARELEQASDKEALIYSVAESLTISPYGVPWEG